VKHIVETKKWEILTDIRTWI